MIDVQISSVCVWGKGYVHKCRLLNVISFGLQHSYHKNPRCVQKECHKSINIINITYTHTHTDSREYINCRSFENVRNYYLFILNYVAGYKYVN